MNNGVMMLTFYGNLIPFSLHNNCGRPRTAYNIFETMLCYFDINNYIQHTCILYATRNRQIKVNQTFENM